MGLCNLLFMVFLGVSAYFPEDSRLLPVLLIEKGLYISKSQRRPEHDERIELQTYSRLLSSFNFFHQLITLLS